MAHYVHGAEVDASHEVVHSVTDAAIGGPEGIDFALESERADLSATAVPAVLSEALLVELPDLFDRVVDAHELIEIRDAQVISVRSEAVSGGGRHGDSVVELNANAFTVDAVFNAQFALSSLCRQISDLCVGHRNVLNAVVACVGLAGHVPSVGVVADIDHASVFRIDQNH